jgi:hypothetical protein
VTSRVLLQRRKYVGALLEQRPRGSPAAEAAPTSHSPYRGKRLEQRRSKEGTGTAPNLANMLEHCRSSAPPAPPHGPDPMLKTSRPQRSPAALDHHVYAGFCPPHINDLVPTVVVIWRSHGPNSTEAPAKHRKQPRPGAVPRRDGRADLIEKVESGALSVRGALAAMTD